MTNRRTYSNTAGVTLEPVVKNSYIPNSNNYSIKYKLAKINITYCLRCTWSKSKGIRNKIQNDFNTNKNVCIKNKRFAIVLTDSSAQIKFKRDENKYKKIYKIRKQYLQERNILGLHLLFDSPLMDCKTNWG